MLGLNKASSTPLIQIKPAPYHEYLSSHEHEFVNVCHKDLLLDFSLTVKAATVILIAGCGSAISSAKEGKSGFIYNLV